MPQFASQQDQIETKKALRSLVTTLEFANNILDKLPATLSEVDEARLKINEALIASYRLNLASNSQLQPENVDDQRSQSMSA